MAAPEEVPMETPVTQALDVAQSKRGLPTVAEARQAGAAALAEVEQAQVRTRLDRQDLLGQLGTLELTRREMQVLGEPATARIAAVKPGGEVYVPGVHYRRLLNEAFGPAAWGLRPLTDVKLDAGKKAIMYREYALVIRGVATSVVIGEAEYQVTNPRLTYGDAAEALRTNALTRLCKDLGVFVEPWDPQWSAAFRQKHCVKVWVDNPRDQDRDDDRKKGPQWRRLDAEPFLFESRPSEDSPNQDKWAERMRARSAAKPVGRGGERRSDQSPSATPRDAAVPAPSSPSAASPAAPPRPVRDGNGNVPAVAPAPPPELVQACRPMKRGAETIYGIRTSQHEYFTDSQELHDLCAAAMQQQRPVRIEFESRQKDGRPEYRWIVEIKQ